LIAQVSFGKMTLI